MHNTAVTKVNKQPLQEKLIGDFRQLRMEHLVHGLSPASWSPTALYTSLVYANPEHFGAR